MRPSTSFGFGTLWLTLLVVLSSVLLMSAGAPAVAQNEPIELRNPYFEWTDVREEGAMFEWSVDVVNNTDAAVRLQIILDLLDDDDRPVNRDEQNNPIDQVTITVEPGARVAVERTGSISYDRAAEVVTYTHRYRASPQ